jgi:hypothetical protein
MILMLVSSYYKEAATFVKQFPEGAVSILTCAGLAQESTNLFYPGFENSTITIEGITVPISAITGVVNFLPVILPEELYFLPEEEREYQAAEFHALLTFFLHSLPCPVINRPSGSGLTGTFNHALYWIDTARKLEIPTIPLVIDSHDTLNCPPVDKPPPYLEIICLNQEILCVSNGNATTLPHHSGNRPEAQQYTLQLAKHSGAEYLKAAFEEIGTKIALARVSLIPDIRNDKLIRCIIGQLEKTVLT